MARRSPPIEKFDITAPVAANFARPPMDDGQMARAAGRAIANIGNTLAKIAAASEARSLDAEVKAASEQGALDAQAAIPMPGAPAAPSQPPSPGLGSPVVPRDGDALALIRKFEGFRASPYWDVNAHRAGYGSDTVTYADGRVARIRPGMTVSREDAERDLARRAADFANTAAGQVGRARWDALPGNVRAALTSVAYNYGSLPKRIVGAVQSGDAAAISQAVLGLAGDNGGVNANRRRAEAAVIGGKGGAAIPEIKPLQLRKDGTPQGEAYDNALVKTGAFRADAALNLGLASISEQFAEDPAGFDKAAGQLRGEYLKAYSGVPELLARAEAEFELRLQPVRNRIYDARDRAAQAEVKKTAGEAVIAQRDLLEKQAYGIGVQDDGDARLSALITQSMNVIDAAEEAGAMTPEGAARERSEAVGRMVQARFDGVFDALASPAEKQAFAENIASPEMRAELLQKLPLGDYQKLRDRYATLARRAGAEHDAANRVEQERFRKLLDDDIASLARTGEGVKVGGLGLDAGEVSRVLGPEAAARWADARQAAQGLFTATDGMARMTPAQIEARLAEIEPAPGSEGYAAKLDIFGKAAGAADRILKARAKDPAMAADETFGRDWPDDIRNDPARLAEARMTAQAALGIPELARQPLTVPEARRMAERLTLYKDQPEALQQATERLVTEVGQQFGAFGDEAMAQVLRVNGISKEASFAALEVMKAINIGQMPEVRDLRRLDAAMDRDMAADAMFDYVQPPIGRRGLGGRPVTAGDAPRPPSQGRSPGGQPKQRRTVPNAAQVELLRKDPSLAPLFDERFGAGTAEMYLKGDQTWQRRTLPDGSVETTYEDGWVETLHPDGTVDGRMGN